MKTATDLLHENYFYYSYRVHNHSESLQSWDQKDEDDFYKFKWINSTLIVKKKIIIKLYVIWLRIYYPLVCLHNCMLTYHSYYKC